MRRNTIQRKLVLAAVQQMHDHPTAERVYALVAAQHPSISRGTVYRNLNQLAADGDLQKIELPESADCFDDTLEPHYHIYCHGCGRLFDVDMEYLQDLEHRVRDPHGFRFEGHTIVFKGICPECKSKL